MSTTVSRTSKRNIWGLFEIFLQSSHSQESVPALPSRSHYHLPSHLFSHPPFQADSGDITKMLMTVNKLPSQWSNLPSPYFSHQQDYFLTFLSFSPSVHLGQSSDFVTSSMIECSSSVQQQTYFFTRNERHWSWRIGSAVKSTCCCCRWPEVDSQHPLSVILTCLHPHRHT